MTRTLLVLTASTAVLLGFGGAAGAKESAPAVRLAAATMIV